MATIAERQQELSDEMMGYYREHGLKYDVEQVEALRSLLPAQTKFEQGALALQTGYQDALMNANMPQQIVDARSQFLKEAREGIDIQGRMGLAQADVVKGFQGAHDALRLDQSRTGIRPDSGIAAQSAQDLAIHKAGAITGARTQARVQGEQEQFGRLGQAAQVGL